MQNPLHRARRIANSQTFQKTRKGLYSINKARAKRCGFPHNITFEEFSAVWPKDNKCRYCRRKMRRLTYSAPSADKIIPARGYVSGNVDIICRLCNVMKSGGDLAFHEAVAARMREVL